MFVLFCFSWSRNCSAGIANDCPQHGLLGVIPACWDGLSPKRSLGCRICRFHCRTLVIPFFILCTWFLFITKMNGARSAFGARSVRYSYPRSQDGTVKSLLFSFATAMKKLNRAGDMSDTFCKLRFGRSPWKGCVRVGNVYVNLIIRVTCFCQ